MSGMLLSLSKSFARIRMEENAWEQRLATARAAAWQADSTLTDMDIRRQQAAQEWSAYGQPRRQQEAEQQRSSNNKKRVKVMEREDDDDDDDKNDSSFARPTDSSFQMTDAEIQAFELEYGVAYDPYYDEPYTQAELPNDVEYTTDRRYGDRIYANGEIFYKHGEDCYFRQGAKPRNIKFWE